MNLRHQRVARLTLLTVMLISMACGDTSQAHQDKEAGEPESKATAEDQPVFESYDLKDLRLKLQEKKGPWLPFLDTSTLSVGIYTLQAGARDPQGPHDQDEVYYVIEGKGTLKVGDDDRAMQAGSIAFVAAHEVHRFHSITQDLLVLVFFSKKDPGKSSSP